MANIRPKVRLFVEHGLSAGAQVGLEPGQAHYLINVMRLRGGDRVALFNGRDGEWAAVIDRIGRGKCSLAVEARTLPQAAGPDVWLVFAPVKRAPLDFVVAKATELGVSALWPVFTRHTAVERVNTGRLRAIVIEAAEQCGRLDVPGVIAPAPLEDALARWPGERRVLLCDEGGGGPPIAEGLAAASGGPWAVLTGPEGGFAAGELDALRKLPFVTPVGLGPRILRAETAALAALACWQAWIGDWGGETSGNESPRSRVSQTVGSK